MTETSLYWKEIEKEARRNAVMRDFRRRTEEDIPEENVLVTRLKAHLNRRTERQTRNRWYELSCRMMKDIQETGRGSEIEGKLREAKEAIRDRRKMKQILQERI